jgi:hypothetical protein
MTRRLVATALALAGLATGCGKVGPPVRASRAKAAPPAAGAAPAPAAAPAEAPANDAEKPEETGP